jgi:D-amino-acid dehydrogenase
MKPSRIGIVGAGVVGACCALRLARQGHQVTLLDPAPPGGSHAASHGNGGWISPASVVPMATPGLWKKIPGHLLDPLGPLTLRWSSLPGLLPWLVAFLRSGSTLARVRTTSISLHALLHDAPERHRAFAAWAGASDLLHHDGLLYVYPDQEAVMADALSWTLRRERGVSWMELDAEALRAKVPALSPRYRLGRWVPAGAWCSDPGEYVLRLVLAAELAGARHRVARVQRLRSEAGRCTGLETDEGMLSFDRVLIAAGIDSPRLARQVGDRLPLASERGYHVVLPQAGVDLPLPVMPSDGRMANTPTLQGLRLAGQVELAHPRATPRWSRADVLLTHAQHCYPDLQHPDRLVGMTRWMGHRPSTPDGLPVIGPSPRCAGLWYACGHGHVGLASAPRTAELIAQGMEASAGERPQAPEHVFGIERFQRGKLGWNR